MKTVQIRKEAIIEAHENAKKSGKKLLEKLLGRKFFYKDIRDILNELEDVFVYHGTTSKEFYKKYKWLPEHIIGQLEVELIVSAYNEGELPDYTNTDQIKYCPIFKMGSPAGGGFSYFDCDYWHSRSSVGARQDFLNKDNMLDAVKKFLPSYEKKMTK